MNELKLYYEDAYKSEFSAYVLNSIYDASRDLYKIELSETYFYPQGGGQPSDIGKIDSKFILEVVKEEETIWHLCKENISERKYVKCQIDFERRYDLMQSHSGQHLLSAVLYREHGVNTIGFHLTIDNLTIDVDRVLESHEVDALYLYVNDMIFKNKKFIRHEVEKHELQALDLRKKPKFDEDITIIEIEDYDFVPCCGTHVKRTGELGLFSIVDIQKYKSGNRIKFTFGMRSMKDAVENANIINKIGNSLSSSKDMIQNSFDIFLQKNEIARKRNAELEMYISNMMAQNIIENKYDFNTFKFLNSLDEILSQAGFGKLINSLISLCEYENFLILAGNSFEKSNELVLISKFSNSEYKIDAIFIVDEICKELGLKGGGTANRAQLKASTKDELEAAFNLAVKKIIEHEYK